MKKILAVTLLSAAVATPAFAADDGFYGAVDVSTFSISNKGPDASDPSAGLRIAAGYHFSKMVAAEVGYAMSGNGDFSGVNYSAKSLQFAVVGTFSVTDQFDLLGKLGYASNKLDGDALTGCAKCSKSDLMYGIGAQYNVTKQLGIRALYENLGKFTDFGEDDASGTTISVGVAYNF